MTTAMHVKRMIMLPAVNNFALPPWQRFRAWGQTPPRFGLICGGSDGPSPRPIRPVLTSPPPVADLDSLIERRRQLIVDLAEVEAALERHRARSAEERPTAGAVLGVKEAAERLATTPDALYRKHARLRLGYKDPLDGKLKFSEQELDAYARTQRRGR